MFVPKLLLLLVCAVVYALGVSAAIIWFERGRGPSGGKRD
jgi:uncharacterized iron-regulated membrane protein